MALSALEDEYVQGPEAVFARKIPMSGFLPSSRPSMIAVMVLLELLGCLLDELVARKDRRVNSRCRRSINNDFSSSHQTSFVKLGTQALLPSGAAHVAKLCTA